MAAILNFVANRRPELLSGMFMEHPCNIFQSTEVKYQKLGIFKISQKIKLAAILNFAAGFFSKSNQVARTLPYTFSSNFMKILQAVLEIGCSQENLVNN